MYESILTPTDGSALAAEGVRHGIALAKAIGARLTAVAVSEPILGILLPGEPEPTFRMTNAEIRQASNDAAKKLLASVSAEARDAGVNCDTVHVYDRFPAAEGILDTARDRNCDLIVMASHGRRGVWRALLGSQAFEVVTRAKVPVLIVRPADGGNRDSPTVYKHILIATDGSELAEKGVDQGLELAKRVNAKVSFVVVSELFTGITLEGEPPIGLFTGSAELKRSSEAAAAKILKRVADKAAKVGVPCELVHVQDKVPAEAIVETAAARGCDLVVMASHGRRGPERFLLGSQAGEVLVRARTPVLVVR